MRPCQKCLENNWSFEFIDETRTVLATCNLCGFQVEFDSKKKKNNKFKKEVSAKYKNIDGKRYLEINGKYEEVGLFQHQKGYMKVLPYNNIGKGFKLFSK